MVPVVQMVQIRGLAHVRMVGLEIAARVVSTEFALILVSKIRITN